VTNPARLATLNQSEDTLVIGMDDGTSVIFEDDGTITLNVAAPSGRPAPVVETRRLRNGRNGRESIRVTIRREEESR